MVSPLPQTPLSDSKLPDREGVCKKSCYIKIVNVWKRFPENHILTALTAQEQRTLPLSKNYSHHGAALAKTLALTSCAPGELLLLASADGGETAPGGSLQSGDVQIDYSTCGRVRPRFALFSSTLSLCSVMRATCSLSPVPPAL